MADRAFAETRFGLGSRGDLALETISDPRGWAVAQLDRFQSHVADVPDRSEIAGDLAEYLAMQRVARIERKRDGPATMMTRADMPQGSAAAKKRVDPDVRIARHESRETYARLVAARVNNALVTPTPFLERMTHFWANHFAVSAQKQTTLGFAGLLEMEAIRPHVAGRFSDMLIAVERHPAMLFYLDQAQSIGPNSQFGSRAAARGNNRGLNENLAREILELHTLGVRTGYSQADVTELARALTGWTIAGIARGPSARFAKGDPGDFAFVELLHEPGVRTILGRRFAEGGEAQGRAVLEMLSVHPATARHVATKLARHFAADDPPPAMIARLERSFLKSGGDLRTVYRALIDSPEAWDVDSAKFRSPWDWSIAALRAVGTRQLQPIPAVALMKELGQPVWMPPSPAGWGDESASWAGPDALVRRVEAAQRMAIQAGDAVDARAIAQKVLGDRLSEKTRNAIARAESPTTGLALFLASPEMLRR